jgi:hypothetical protein
MRVIVKAAMEGAERLPISIMGNENSRMKHLSEQFYESEAMVSALFLDAKLNLEEVFGPLEEEEEALVEEKPNLF